MNLNGVKIGLAITGSFCTFNKVYKEVENLVTAGAKVTPIFSFNAATLDTRFGNAKEWINKFEALTGNKSIMTIPEAEPVGPKNMFDVIFIAPCTGNTIAKLANAMTDTPVLMAAKSHVRNQRPVLIAVSTNDGLGMNAKNLGILMNSKHYFFVPYGQDNPIEKKNSLVAKLEFTIPAILQALEGKQMQPMIVEYKNPS